MYNEKANVLYLGLDTTNVATFISDFRNIYHLSIAGTPQEAVQIMRKMPVEALLVEQNLPEMSGVQFFSSIMAEFPHPIRILINASNDADTLIQAINHAHVYRSLPIPWDKNEMRQSLASGIKLYRETNRRYTAINQMQQESLKNQHLLNFLHNHVAKKFPKEMFIDKENLLENKRSHVTAMYINVVNLETFLSQNEPSTILKYMKLYIEFIQKNLAIYDGLINKFVGGNILSIFSPLANVLNHMQKAVFAALTIISAQKIFNEQMMAMFDFALELNIGIHSGGILIGNIAAQQFLANTAIGDAVNIAIALSNIISPSPNKILIGEEIYQMIYEHVDSILLTEEMNIVNTKMAVYQVNKKN